MSIFGQPANVPLLGLDRLLTQQAVIERDQGTPDAYGAESAFDWDELATVPCFMWWGTGAMITRMGQQEATPEVIADRDIGGMLMPFGTDINAHDRVARVLDENGDVFADGPFKLLAVSSFEGVTELTFQKVS